MSNSLGKTIKLFLIDGVPEGMRTAEIMSWTGHVLYAPRASIAALLTRPEVQRTGVYLLIGPAPEAPDQVKVYVGEGDQVATRIASHNKDEDKDFWEHVCVITSKDLNLTKAHARYLESKLIAILKNEGRAILANKSEPDFAKLPEADLADMNDFIMRLQILLPVLGADFVRSTPKITPSEGLTSSPPTSGTTAIDPAEIVAHVKARKPMFYMTAGGLHADAVEIDGQMVILSRSGAKAVETPGIPTHIRALREQLRRAGKLVTDGPDKLRFVDDVAFNSPSAAASAVMGQSRNGRVDWVNSETGETYGAWQDRLVQATEVAGR